MAPHRTCAGAIDSSRSIDGGAKSTTNRPSAFANNANSTGYGNDVDADAVVVVDVVDDNDERRNRANSANVSLSEESWKRVA